MVMIYETTKKEPQKLRLLNQITENRECRNALYSKYVSNRKE